MLRRRPRQKKEDKRRRTHQIELYNFIILLGCQKHRECPRNTIVFDTKKTRNDKSVGEKNVRISTGKGNIIIERISVSDKDEASAFDESEKIELKEIFHESTIGENLN